MLFLTTLESVLAPSAQSMTTAASRTRAPRSIARSVTWPGSTKVVRLLLDSRVPLEETLARLQRLFQTNPTRQRPERRVARASLKYSRPVRYLLYHKRLTAELNAIGL